MLLGVASCLGTATLCGLFNGGLIVVLRVHPFIITLGAMAILRGIAFVATKGQSVGGFPPALRDSVRAGGSPASPASAAPAAARSSRRSLDWTRMPPAA